LTHFDTFTVSLDTFDTTQDIFSHWLDSASCRVATSQVEFGLFALRLYNATNAA